MTTSAAMSRPASSTLLRAADGNAATVVLDGHRAVECTVTSMRVQNPAEVLVDRVVDDLPTGGGGRPVVDVTDVHPGALANGLEAFEHLDAFSLP